MTEKIIIAGSGGQGIMLFGKVLAESAVREDKYVTWLPAYGAEVRGGTAYCMVIISDEEIGSPYIAKADTLIAMNKPSLEKFRPRLSAKGLLIINSSLSQEKPGQGVSYPFTEIAEGLGNIKVANMAALGCYVAAGGAVKAESVIKTMRGMVPRGREELLEINQKALWKGKELYHGRR
jgi:2-oxoglutarate ferredoxin oxidoreductase subunit gamma